jgi:hypothetical protein
MASDLTATFPVACTEPSERTATLVQGVWRVYPRVSALTRTGFAFLEGGSAMRFARIKDVFVRAYRRFRLGRWEFVRQHFRSHPRQMELFLV